MTSSIINWIIDKYLGDMLEINMEQTKSSLWNGEIEMSNLKIKPEIFKNMNLPYFELVHGYVGKMKITMSLPRFYLYPIKVVIEKVFFHAKQKKLETINKKTEIENMEYYKNKELENDEQLTNEINNLQKEGSPGMMTQIINNLEIEIKDICIRFDDDLSYDLIPFSFGILLKNLYIKTPENNINNDSNITDKILKMENLSIFMDTYEYENKLINFHTKIVNTEKTKVSDELTDFLGPLIEYYKYCISETNENIYNNTSHQYLVFNLGFFLQLSMNESLQNSKPKYSVDCKLDTINMAISLVQIKAIMKLLSYQDLNSKYQIGLSKEIYQKKITDDEKTGYIENYIWYFNYKYGPEKNEEQANNIKLALEKVEFGLKYEEIKKMRDEAKYQMDHDKEIDEIDKKINELKGGTGFFSYFSSGPSEEQKKEIEKLEEKKLKLLNEKKDISKEKLQRLMSLNAKKEENELNNINDEYCLYKATFFLPEFNLDINREKTEKMLTMNFKNFNIMGEIRKNGQLFTLSIGDIFVKQHQLKNSVYQTLIASIEQKNEIKNESKNEAGACYIEFENNPKFEKSNYRFKFRNSKRLIITINMYSIQYLTTKILDSLATTISKFGSERYIGTGEIQNLIKSGFETNYISGGFQHFNIDLDILMKSPIIVYPQDILDKSNDKCLLIKCGDFKMISELPPRQNCETDYSKIKDKKLLFDVYKMYSENFCMATLENFDGNLSELAQIKGENLVDNIIFDFQFGMLFEQKNIYFEKMNLKLNIGNCIFMLRDTQLIFFIDFLKKMKKIGKQLSFDLETKTPLEYKEDKQNKEDKEKEKKEESKIIKKEKNQELVKKNDEKKDEPKISDRMWLIIELSIENIELHLMKSKYLKELNILNQENIIIDNDYKEFIIFQMKQFYLLYSQKDNGNMNVNISILSTTLKDKETLITDAKNPKGNSLVNEEFSNLIQMKSTVSKNKENIKENIFLEDNNSLEILESESEEENENENKFMVLNYFYDGINSKQTVDIILQKIHICFSMDAMARIYQYYSYYFGMYCQSCDEAILILANMEEKFNKEKLKQQIKDINENNIMENLIDDENNSNNLHEVIEKDNKRKKIFGKKFLENLCKDLKAVKKFKKKLKDNIYEKAAEKKINKQKEELSKKHTIKKNKSEISVKLEMKEILMEFPLDDTKAKTQMTQFKFNFITTFLMNSEYNETIDGNGKLIKTEYISNNKKLITKFLNISFNIGNFDKNKNYTNYNYTDSQIIQGLRLQINLNSFLLFPYQEKSVMLININLEPLTFSIGFRQTRTVLLFSNKCLQFLSDMYKDYDDPLIELQKIKNNNNINLISFDEDNIYNTNSNETNRNNNELSEEEKIKNKQKIEDYKIKELEKKKLEALKNDNNENERVINNTDNINNMYDIKIIFDKISIKFLDDSNRFLIPLLDIETNNILIRYIQNSEPDSVENISNLILESISSKEIPLENYDIKGLYKFVEIIINLSVNFYNDHIYIWEPIIENYNCSLKVDQVASFSRMRVLFDSEDIFNMNISIISMNVLNRFLKKLFENEENNNKRNIDNNVNENIAVEFINYTGVNIDFWLDAEESLNKEKNNCKYKNILASGRNNKKTINKNDLVILYQQLSESQAKILKDKFSFQINSYLPVYDNDFSTEYTTSFRIKKEIKALEEIKNLYEENNNEQKNNIEKENDSNYITQSIETSVSISKKLLDEETQRIQSERNKSNNIESNNEFETNEIEILIKVRQNGTFKQIIFTSNIAIYNKLQIPISLLFISEYDFKNKYNSEENKINFSDTQNNLLLSRGRKKSIPLFYLTEKYRIYISFHDKSNPDENEYSLLYDNFEDLYKNLDNFIKYDKANLDNENRELTSNDIIDNNFSKILQIHRKNKEFFIASNLIVQRGINDIIKKSPKLIKKSFGENKASNKDKININNLLEKYRTDFYYKIFSYLLVLDESILIENQIPFNSKFELKSEKLDKEITIPPLQQKEFLQFDETTKIKLSLLYNEVDFVSDFLDLENLDYNNIINTNNYSIKDLNNYKELQIKLFSTEDKNNNLSCTLKYENSIDKEKLKGAFDSKFEKCIYSFTKKKKLLFYIKCIIINKTENLLYIKGENESKDNFCNHNIHPLKINLFNIEDINQSFRIKTSQSDFSEKFNINNTGNIGVTSLEIKDENKTKILDLGVNISNSWYFSNSIFITIEPRFLLINKFGVNILFKQYNDKISKDENDNSNLFENQIINNENIIKLTLLKVHKNMKKMIQVKFEDSNFFSCPFDLQEIEDINIKIPISENMKKILEARNKEIEKEIEEFKANEEKNKKENIENKNDNKKNENEKHKILSPEEEKELKNQEEIEKKEKFKIQPRKYIIFNQNYQNYVLINVVKKAYNGLICIVLFPPKNPKYIIQNESNTRFTFIQKNDNFHKEIIILEKNETIPFTWSDMLQNEKILIAKIDDTELEININDIKIIKKDFEIIDKNTINNKNKCTFYFQTIVDNNRSRKLIIKNENTQNIYHGHFLSELKGIKNSYNTKYKINLKGFGLSIISNEPKEIFYISLYDNIIEASMISYKKGECEHMITNIKLIIKNFQIDYCLKDNFKSMIIPLNPINPLIEEKYNEKELPIPLFQGIVTFHQIINPITQISSYYFPQVDFTMQSIKLNISQYQLMSLKNLYDEIMPELDFYISTPEKLEKNIEYNNLDDFQKIIFSDFEKEEFIYEPSHYDKNLNTKINYLPEEIIFDSENQWMFFIKYIGIGALDIILSTRIDINSLGDILPSFFMKILSAVGNALTHITDFHIKCTSLIYQDVFTDVYSLINEIYTEYFTQIKLRIFKIIGSLDILGNPTSYAKNIGEGFMQLIEEPRKGLINGPIAFGEGIAIGFNNFIFTIISSTFDSIGKISGTILSSLEVLQGKKSNFENQEAQNIFDGFYKGIKEGIFDFGKGLKEFVLKPYEGAKKGIGGFFKGVGSGLMGVVISPFTVTFRIANNIFIGIKNNANYFKFNPKLQTERFRLPRNIEKNCGLCCYDESKAIIKGILDFLEDDNIYDIIYFKEFKYLCPEYERNFSTLVLTNICVMVIYKAKDIVFKIELNEIKKIEVHREKGTSNYCLIFYLKDGEKDFIRTKDFELCSGFYLTYANNNNDEK